MVLYRRRRANLHLHYLSESSTWNDNMLQFPPCYLRGTPPNLPAALALVICHPLIQTAELKEWPGIEAEAWAQVCNLQHPNSVLELVLFQWQICLGLYLFKIRGLLKALCNLGGHEPGLSTTDQEPWEARPRAKGNFHIKDSGVSFPCFIREPQMEIAWRDPSSKSDEVKCSLTGKSQRWAHLFPMKIPPWALTPLNSNQKVNTCFSFGVIMRGGVWWEGWFRWELTDIHVITADLCWPLCAQHSIGH